jgi:hypothetical protein
VKRHRPRRAVHEGFRARTVRGRAPMPPIGNRRPELMHFGARCGENRVAGAVSFFSDAE